MKRLTQLAKVLTALRFVTDAMTTRQIRRLRDECEHLLRLDLPTAPDIRRPLLAWCNAELQRRDRRRKQFELSLIEPQRRRGAEGGGDV